MDVAPTFKTFELLQRSQESMKPTSDLSHKHQGPHSADNALAQVDGTKPHIRHQGDIETLKAGKQPTNTVIC